MLSEEEESEVLGVFKRPEDIVVEYGMETWLEAIKEVTFETISIPLTIKQIEAITAAIQAKWKGSSILLSEEQKEVLGDLERSIDKFAESFGEFFIKFSTRSPKDAVFENPHELVQEYLKKELLQLKSQKSISEISVNDKLIAFTKAANLALKLSTGKSAMDLILVSDRVYTDLKTVLQNHTQHGTEPNIQLILRKWEEIPIQMEFRGYVCKGKLNGLSQYFHYLYFEELKEKKPEILQKVQTLWDSIKQNITQTSYVIDFCILPNGTTKVIEINPFHFSTGAPFFGWKKGTPGRAILLNGPFEFRFREIIPDEDLMNRYMVPFYAKFINTFLTDQDDSVCSCQ